MLWLLIFAAALAITLVRQRDSLGGRRRWVGWLLVIVSVVVAIAIAPPLVALRKEVGAVLMPTTVVWIVLVALVIRSWRDPRWRGPLIAALAAYSIAGSPITSYFLMRSLERPFESIFPLEETSSYDALLVMGGGSARAPAMTRPATHNSARRATAYDSRPPSTNRGALQFSSLRDRRSMGFVTSAPIPPPCGSKWGSRPKSWCDFRVPATAPPRSPPTPVSSRSAAGRGSGWSPRRATCRGRSLSAAGKGYGWIRCLRTSAPIHCAGHPGAIVPNGGGFASVEEAVWEYVGLAAVHLFGG